MNWPYSKLSEVAEIERNGIASDAISTGTRYLGLEHIESGGKILGAATVEAGDLASTKFRFTRKHVLYGKLRPYLAKIAMPDFDGICSTDIVPIMPGPRLDRSYLTHFLRQPSMIEFANSRTTGANLPRLSPKALAEFEIPLPPLEEQKRLAAILDQADELRRKRQRALDRLNELGQAIFIEMFGDPKKETSEWEKFSFAETCEDQTARSEKLQRSEYQSSGEFPVIDQGQSFVAGYSDNQEMVCQSPSPVVVFGDHTRAVKYIDFPFVIGADGAKVLVPTRRFQAQFFAELLRLMPIPDLGYSRHMREIKRLMFPCPPMDKQILFVRRCAEISQQFRAFSDGAKGARSLFAALQQRAFSGGL